MIIDTKRLRADLGVLARECRALKDLLGQRWTGPMADEQRRLARLRVRTTELCVLRAWMRKRLHVRVAPRPIRDSAADWDARAWHDRIAERAKKDYERVPIGDAGATATGGAR